MTEVKIKNIYKALRCQLPLGRLLRNFFVNGNGWGLFSVNSHINKKSGKPKVVYATYEEAKRSADALSRKYGGDVSAYKCIFCDGYHIGNNR